MEVCDLEATDFVQYWPMHDNLLYVTRVYRDRLWFKNALPVFRHFTNTLRWLRSDPSVLQNKSLHACALLIKGMLWSRVHEPHIRYLLETNDDRTDPTRQMQDHVRTETLLISTQDSELVFGDYLLPFDGCD